MSASGRRGYSFIELIVALALFLIVLVAIIGVLLHQRRFYAAQAQVVDTRNAIRIALDVLSGELREASPGDGDLYAVAPDSIAIRSSLGFGVVCSVSGDGVGLWNTAGVFGESARDSLLVFVEGRPDTRQDDAWRSVRIQAVRNDPAAPCVDGRIPDLELRIAGDLTGIRVGAPVRAFRPYIYRLYQGTDDLWWLGQRLRGGAFQPVTGPFQPPESGGLRFEFFAADGTTSLDPERIVSADIHVRGQSADPVRLTAEPDFYTDTLSTIVYLRNAGIASRIGSRPPGEGGGAAGR